MLVVLAVIVLPFVLACSAGEFIVTLTPTPGKGILPTMTVLPTVVYPTLTPTQEPTDIPSVVCSDQIVSIVCKATVCVVRTGHESGRDNIAYTVPNKVIIDGAVQCKCQSCAPVEQDWFFLGQTGVKQFWALSMPQVWETTNNGE